jgi:hypothetical protein
VVDEDRVTPPIVGQTTIAGSEFVGRVFLRYLLPVMFIVLASGKVQAALLRGSLGIDAEIYYRASVAFLAGTNPWDAFAINEVSGRVYHFSALPTMVLIGVPFTLLPESVAVALVIVLAALASVYVVRKLGLPWYWLAFPPLVEGVLSANPSLLVLALLLSGFAWIAPLLKVYAFVPMVGEGWWRAFTIGAGVLVATVLVFPDLWLAYLADFLTNSGRLMVEANGGHSAMRDPWLLAGTVIALVLIVRVDRRGAGWLMVPALWPASQFHWSTLAMPVMTPALALLLAIPEKGMPAVAVMVYAIIRRRDLWPLHRRQTLL